MLRDLGTCRAVTILCRTQGAEEFECDLHHSTRSLPSLGKPENHRPFMLNVLNLVMIALLLAGGFFLVWVLAF